MSEASKDTKSCDEKNKLGPDYFSYYKHLLSGIYSQEVLPFPELDSESSAGSYSQVEAGGILDKKKGHKGGISSASHFAGGIGQELSDLKKERLRSILNQSADCLNREADMILNQILATFQITAELREKEQSCFYSTASDEDVREPFSNKKRKASDYLVPNSSDTLSQTLKQLDEMEKDLEDYLNFVVSRSRPMSYAEKQQLGRKIRKLPMKALDRVVQLTSSARCLSDDIYVNLEKQDNLSLWRLYYYVETVLKANRL